VLHSVATAQISNWRAERIREANPIAIEFHTGRLTLLNCDIKPELIKFHPNAARLKTDEKSKLLVQNMQFLVVGVNGEMPLGTMVQVETTNPNPPLKPGQFDLNIRNNPAPIASNRLSPLPGTLQSIVVASWSYGLDRQLIETPKYTLSLVGRPDVSGNRPTLKSISVEPQQTWYRAQPNDPTPTVEVTLP